MVEAIEERAGTPLTIGGARIDDRSLADRAARALTRLRLGAGEMVAESVEAVLVEKAPGEPPAQPVALAALHWPLVVSTNYDDLYVAAVHQRELRTRIGSRKDAPELERRSSPVVVYGRSPTDCHRVLCSLTHSAPPILWAVQGYLGGQATIEHAGGRELYRNWALPQGATDLKHPGPGGGLGSRDRRRSCRLPPSGNALGRLPAHICRGVPTEVVALRRHRPRRRLSARPLQPGRRALRARRPRS